MSENLTVDVFTSLIPQIGLGALFFWIYMKERGTNQIMVETLLAAFQKSTEAQVKTTNAIENNTKALEQLTTKVETTGVNTQQIAILSDKVDAIWRRADVKSTES